MYFVHFMMINIDEVSCLKIYGIFRGFPGLGRVMSGLTLLNTLEKDFGAEVKSYTYMQGLTALSMFNYKNSIDVNISKNDVTSLGLDPVCKASSEIINDILRWQPDIVLLDGEPLITKLLCLCYDKNKIITLLNPSDLNNKAIPYSTSLFFKDAFLSGGCSIVHGINCDINDVEYYNNCKVYYINTILRNKIIAMKIDRNPNLRINQTSKISNSFSSNKNISCILGGGSKSFSENFVESTINIGKNIIKAASMVDEYHFNIFCNDDDIYNSLIVVNKQENVKIFKDIADTEQLYKDADLIICRAGRNTTSELLYLDIPSILIAAGNDYRASEQKSNIENIVNAYPTSTSVFYNDDYNILVTRIKKMLDVKNVNNGFIPGNLKAIEIILKVGNKNSKE